MTSRHGASWGSGGRGFKSPLPDQTRLPHKPQQLTRLARGARNASTRAPGHYSALRAGGAESSAILSSEVSKRMDHETLISRIEIAGELGVQSLNHRALGESGLASRPKMKLSSG